MEKVRKKYWVPKFRTILKKEKRKCEKCTIMAAKPYPEPQRRLLPEKRVTEKYSFAVTGVDFIGSFDLKEGKQEMNGYVVVFSCATSRAVYFKGTRRSKQLLKLSRSYGEVKSCMHIYPNKISIGT